MTSKIWKCGHNNHKGWWYTFSDGATGWVHAWSKDELRVEERKHGKLIKWLAGK